MRQNPQWNESYNFKTRQKVWTFDMGLFAVQVLDWELYPLNFSVSCPHLNIEKKLDVNSLEEAQKEALEMVDSCLRLLRLKLRQKEELVSMAELRQQQKNFTYGDKVRIPGCTDIYYVEQNRGDRTFVCTGHVSTEMVTASLELVEKDQK